MNRRTVLGILVCAVALGLGPARGFAQEKTPSKTASAKAQADQIARLDWLVGTWKGKGWAEVAPGKRETFTSSEIVRRKIGGVALLVEGLHKSSTRGAEGAVVHDAMAVITYDEVAKQVRFRGMEFRGSHVDSEFVLGDKTGVWSKPIPNVGTTRFTIRLNEAGQWHEVGEMSRDGKTWKTFFEMTLDKVE